MILDISLSNSAQDSLYPRDDEEVIFESSLESFPASDPPAWVFGRDRAPPERSREVPRPAGDVKRIPGHILERALAALKEIRKRHYGRHT